MSYLFLLARAGQMFRPRFWVSCMVSEFLFPVPDFSITFAPRALSPIFVSAHRA
jgi:hypothetical protein